MEKVNEMADKWLTDWLTDWLFGGYRKNEHEGDYTFHFAWKLEQEENLDKNCIENLNSKQITNEKKLSHLSEISWQKTTFGQNNDL
jgi:hypothetical protein